ncbi:hypothetical protein ACLB1Q_33620 [Escherichia coli]
MVHRALAHRLSAVSVITLAGLWCSVARAYTEMSLFARIDENGKLTLVNHLGIDLGETPEQILSKLDDDRIKDDDVRHDGRHAHDYDYVHRVRDIEADSARTL